jgi:hypothetical protein
MSSGVKTAVAPKEQYWLPSDTNIVVIPDIHAQLNVLAKAVERTYAEPPHYVFLGDCLGGQQTAETLHYIRSLDPRTYTALEGNWERITRNALETGTEAADWRDFAWPQINSGILQSYRCANTGSRADRARRLREAMQETGDWHWLNALQPYAQNDELVAVHAGLLRDVSWPEQAQAMRDSAAAPLESEPAQLFSIELALPGSAESAPDGRKLLTGHEHLSRSAEARRQGQRYYLASYLNRREPLFVWESATDTIHTIEQ